MRMVFAAMILFCMSTVPVGAQPIEQAQHLLNAFRAEHGLGPVGPSIALDRAARRHARDMARRGFFDHRGSNGSNVMQRARRAGYKPCMVAENLAKGQRSLNEVMRDWINSPGHRSNMLLDGLTHYGLVRGKDNIWVMVLAARTC